MTDRLDPLRRSRLMQKVRTKGTGPEREIRSLLHRLGYRFWLHRKDFPGTPDIVFARRRIILFINGCFWHAHGCRKGQPPKSSSEYWGRELEANRDRDRRAIEALALASWQVEGTYGNANFRIGRRSSPALTTFLSLSSAKFLQIAGILAVVHKRFTIQGMSR